MIMEATELVRVLNGQPILDTVALSALEHILAPSSVLFLAIVPEGIK